MKLRHALAFVILPIVLVLAILQGGTLLTRSYMDEASLQANSALRLAVAALAGHLGRYEPLPALIADHDDIEGLLQAPENPALRKVANNYLKEINSLLGSSDIYVMTPDGNTVAASNYDKPGTFVGENFSYRPYFQDAVAGRPARCSAISLPAAASSLRMLINNALSGKCASTSSSDDSSPTPLPRKG